MGIDILSKPVLRLKLKGGLLTSFFRCGTGNCCEVENQ